MGDSPDPPTHRTARADSLGAGFYLWQESPGRAQAWAVDRFGDDAAVVAARITVDGCLGLLNPWQRLLPPPD